MPANNVNKPDQLNAMIVRYLTVDNVLHQEAYEVVSRWYGYLNALANSTGNQLGVKVPSIGLPAVELAFETPITGFIGNTFWQQHGHTILPLVSQDIVHHGMLTRFKDKPDLVVAVNIVARYGFIGQIVALVNQDGLASWRQFETEFRQLMETLVRGQLENGSKQ